MDVFYNFDTAYRYKGLLLALGNFDGVHVGHQTIFKKLVTKAKELNLTPAVLTFYPHPLEILHPQKAPPQILNLEDRLKKIEELGIKVCFCLKFDHDFAKITPHQFVKDFLEKYFDLKGLFVGFNYSFGYQGRGNPSYLEVIAAENYFVEITAPVKIGHITVSSTLIRNLIGQGKVDQAFLGLGYYPFLRGHVIHGDKRGSQLLGFPTINLDLSDKYAIPSNGVYNVTVDFDQQTVNGIANIGIKPTFNLENKNSRNLEVHLLNYNGDLYFKNVKVNFLKFVRHEQKFNKVTELKKQILADAQQAEIFFSCQKK